MTFKIELQTVNGEPAGDFATNLSDWWAGMEFRAEGNRLMRIVAINDKGDVWRVEPVECQEPRPQFRSADSRGYR